MANHLPDAPVLRNPLAETLAAGRLGVALLVQKVHSVDIALAARTCGFDALSVDLEHSVIPEAAAAQICITAMQVGVTPLVRVPSHAAHHANRLLDAGACGIVAPHVNTAEEARAIVQACRFAPQGQRSVAGNWPHLGYRHCPAGDVGRLQRHLDAWMCCLKGLDQRARDQIHERLIPAHEPADRYCFGNRCAYRGRLRGGRRRFLPSLYSRHWLIVLVKEE